MALCEKPKQETIKLCPINPRVTVTCITDWEKFREFAQVHGDKTQAEMAQLWEGEISDRTISRALKKIGFTRKKRLMVTEKEMKRARQSFLEELSIVSPETIVYVDESPNR